MQRRQHVLQDAGLCLGLGVDAISLHPLGARRYALQQKWHEGQFPLLRQLLVDGVKSSGVAGAVIRWNMHAGQQHLCARALAQINDFRKALSNAGKRLAAQGIVATELDNDDAGLMPLQ